MTQEASARDFAIHRVYAKDISFEAPSAPEIFRKQWSPDMNLDMQSRARVVEENIHEVTLSVTVTVQSEGKAAFIVEVDYCGIFSIRGFDEPQLQMLIGSVCPSILFPYVREIVGDLVMRGSFPQLILAPVNFDALYAEQQASRSDAETSS